MAIEEVVGPSGAVFRVRGLKVREFKLITDRALMDSGEVYERFLDACLEEVVDPGPAYESSWTRGTKFSWKKALQGDRFATLLAIRMATHPEPFGFDVGCSRCGEDVAWEVDLRSLPRTPYPASSIELFVNRKPVELLIDGRVVTYELMTGAEEERVRNALQVARRPERGRGKDYQFDPFVDGILTRLKVDGFETGSRELREWFEDLEASAVSLIESSIHATSGGVDTTIEVDHKAKLTCGARTKVELPLGTTRFWMPRAA